MGAVPNAYMKMSVLSVVLIPLTLAYAIVRYRLMDVDIIFRRGYAYTLATLCIVAAFYALIFTLGSLVKQNFKDMGNTVPMTVMLVSAFLFDPIRNWIQERLDKHFYRDRYDYRRTLVEFARELSSETDLDTMIASVGERLLQTLGIKHLAVFLAGEGEEPPAFPTEEGDGTESAPERRQPRRARSQLPELEPARTVSLLRAHPLPARRRFPRLAGFACARPSRISTSPITCPARCAAAPSPTSA